MSLKTMLVIVLNVTLLSVSCGTENEMLGTDPTVTKGSILDLQGKADVNERICQFLGFEDDCDICEALDFYGDGECDDFCESIDPDCEVEDPSDPEEFTTVLQDDIPLYGTYRLKNVEYGECFKKWSF